MRVERLPAVPSPAWEYQEATVGLGIGTSRCRLDRWGRMNSSGHFMCKISDYADDCALVAKEHIIVSRGDMPLVKWGHKTTFLKFNSLLNCLPRDAHQKSRLQPPRQGHFPKRGEY